MLWRMLKVVPTFGQIYEKSTVPTLYAHGDLLPSACRNLQGPVDGICFLPKCGTNWEREMKVRQQESKNVTFIATEGSWRVWSRCGSPVGYLRLHPWIELTYLIIEGAGQPHGTAEQRRAACRQAKVKEKKEEEELEHVQLLLPNWREQGEARGVRLGARTRSLFHSPKSMQRWAPRPTVKILITA